MSFDEFKQQLLVVLRQQVFCKSEKAYVVAISEIVKNNGVVLHGITITEEGGNLSPTIYINEYYKSYMEGEFTIPEIAAQVYAVFDENKITEEIPMDFFMDYGEVRKRVVYKLINYDKNITLLQDVPHKRYLDLAIVYQCMIEHERFGNATILIHNKHMDLWGVEDKQLEEEARINTPQLLRPRFRQMGEILRDILEESRREMGNTLEDEDHLVEAMEQQGIPMYVLSNESKIHGASCILYPSLLTAISNELKSNLYILPSSIHEVIILPDDGKEDPNHLGKMVQEVNDTQLEPDEVLADHVYYYDRLRDELLVLTSQ